MNKSLFLLSNITQTIELSNPILTYYEDLLMQQQCLYHIYNRRDKSIQITAGGFAFFTMVIKPHELFTCRTHAYIRMNTYMFIKTCKLISWTTMHGTVI